MIQHLALSIRHALEWDLEHPGIIVGAFAASNDIPVDRLREYLKAQLAEGRELLPMAPCDDFDPKTGCRGHDDRVLERRPE